jgi:threonine/homoserine/homoserine lactone efflux protein
MIELIKVIPAFALTALILVMVPGQGVAMVLRQSLIGGKKAARFSVAGNSTGLVIWGTASALGLSAIFAKSHLAFNILKYTGMVVLLILAIQTLFQIRKEFGKFDLSGTAQTNPRSAYQLGLITNLSNVKAAVYAVAFIPNFVPRNFSLGWGIFLLALVQTVVSTSWYFTMIAAIDYFSEFLGKPKVRKSLTAISAVGMILLATALLFTKPR